MFVTTTRYVRALFESAVAGPSTNEPVPILTFLSTVMVGSMTVTTAVAAVEVSSKPVGIAAASNAPSWLVRLVATVAELVGVCPLTTAAPPVRWVARRCAV